MAKSSTKEKVAIDVNLQNEQRNAFDDTISNAVHPVNWTRLLYYDFINELKVVLPHFCYYSFPPLVCIIMHCESCCML